jgi:hypothetical protein
MFVDREVHRVYKHRAPTGAQMDVDRVVYKHGALTGPRRMLIVLCTNMRALRGPEIIPGSYQLRVSVMRKTVSLKFAPV